LSVVQLWAFAGLLIPMVLIVNNGWTMTISFAPAVLAAFAFCVQLTIAVLSGYDAQQWRLCNGDVEAALGSHASTLACVRTGEDEVAVRAGVYANA
jgi:hypothetical protein